MVSVRRSGREVIARVRANIPGAVREDVYDELQNRMQAPEEKVANYLADVRCIIAQFERPPSLAKQLQIVFRNLHSKFRHFLERKSVRNFEDLGKFGVEYERRREIDTRYLPPPPRGKSRIPAAAFRRAESVVRLRWRIKRSRMRDVAR